MALEYVALWLGPGDLTEELEHANAPDRGVIAPYTPAEGRFAVGLSYPTDQPYIIVTTDPVGSTWGDDRLWFCNLPESFRDRFQATTSLRA